MVKKRVMTFFAFLIIFAAILMALQISMYGSLTGFATSNVPPSNVDYKGAFSSSIYIIIILAVGFFVVRFVYNHSKRIKYKQATHFERNLIKLDLASGNPL